MSAKKAISPRLAIGLTIAIVLDTGLQLFWKAGVANIPDMSSIAGTVAGVLRDPLFLLVIGLMAAQLVNWLKVLEHADLSFAKPFTSLSYVTVAVLSVVLLGETIAPLQIVGILIVVAGVWCVGRTRQTTVGSGSRPQ